LEIILKSSFGSHLYGTNTIYSDKDYKSVYIPSAEDILLQRIKYSIQHKRPKEIFEKNNSEDIDEEIYSLDKFLDLVYQGQTVALDLLFSDDSSHIKKTWIWDMIIKNRHRLISRRSESFIGYCRQQANKYGIKGSRVAASRIAMDCLENLVSKYGRTKKLGEYHEILLKIIESNEFIDLISIPIQDSREIIHLSVCDRKMPYTSSLGSAYDIVKRIFDEYGNRALQAEKNEGVDWKALSHAVRIGQQAIELFNTHNITFPRPNSKELLSIKLGERPYKEVAELIEELFVGVEEAASKSTLPKEADKEWIENFLIDIYGNRVYEYVLR
jgi:hypothetical protein